MIDWITPRLYNIPLLDRQIDQALLLYNQIRHSILDGDILGVQKMADFHHSVKKRIQQLQQFYNRNCLDERVRYLQGSRMKLVRILAIAPTTSYEKSLINTPWKGDAHRYSSRQSDRSGSRSVTPRKVFKAAKPKQEPKKESLMTNRSQNEGQGNQHTERSAVHSNRNHPLHPSNKKIVPTSVIKPSKASRRTELQPPKQHSKSYLQPPPQPQQRLTPKPKDPETQLNNQATPQSRLKSKAGSSSQKVMGESSSMKRWNDLIFTIKMTKEEYNDFMEVKKKINQSTQELGGEVHRR